MEYFNLQNKEYFYALKQPVKHYKLKVEFLNYYETPIDEITQDISQDSQGQISINYQQLVRRSCNFTLINVEDKYLPSQNSVVWYDRKFRLWIGLVSQSDVYWFSQGIFIINDASSDGSTVSISAVDKGSRLNGETKLGMTETEYIIETGVTIKDLVYDTLMLPINNTLPIDSVEPLVDLTIGSETIQAEINVSQNNYIGSIFTNIADGYGADIWYDTNGRLNIRKSVNVDKPDGYKYMGHSWEFDNLRDAYSNRNMNYEFGGINAVTVYTNATNLEKDVAYTAYNNNPISPLRVSAIGIRRKEAQEIKYVDVSEEEMKQRCKDYANYLLLQESLMGMSLSFNHPIIPHLDVNTTIGVTDSKLNLENDTFVIQSITMPLGAGEMSITATNSQWLPNNTDLEWKGV